MNIADLTTAQLKSIIAIKERIESLQTQLNSVGGGDLPSPKHPAPAKRKYRVTAAHKRKLIKALAKARQIRAAKLNGSNSDSKPAKKDRRSSPAVRAKIAAAARARWAKVRAEGKKTL
jgi:hypothetical protein